MTISMRYKNLRLVFALIVVVVLGLCAGFTFQDASAQNNREKDLRKERTEVLNKIAEGKVKRFGEKDTEKSPRPADAGIRDPMMPLPPSALLSDPPTKEKYLAALQEYYTYHIAGLQNRRQVFKWQLFSSKVIFAVVLVLVFAGIYFAAVQFHTGLGRGEERTEFIALGIKVSSPILGVIILVISLAFFYLYLVYVYPIEDTF